MKRILILTGLLLLMGTSLLAQTVRVTGRVTDAADGSTLPGVSVVVKGTTQGTVTDINGRYEVTTAPNAVLVFSFIGMTPQEVPVDGKSVINVSLESETALLEEVIVVAYGTARRSSFTGSASQVTSEKIESRPISHITRAIEGQSAGVQVTSGSGQPGTGQTIRVRGYSSFNADSNPLYIVDGVPYDLDISNLNPNDIESISVLKDASATALYGNRAANGVIMITTKRGSAGRSQFEVRGTQGFSVRGLPEYDLASPMEYVQMNWQALVNQLHYSEGVPLEDARLYAGGIHPNQGAVASLFTGTNTGDGRLAYNPFNVAGNQVFNADGSINPSAQMIYSADDLDWAKALTQLGDRKEYNVLYSGGNAKTDFFVSGGYLNENGYLLKTDFERVTGRLNVNTQATEWFRTGINLSANVSFSQTARDESTTGYVNPFFFSRNIGSIYPVYAQQRLTGDYILDENGQKIYDLGNMAPLGLPFRPEGAFSGRHVLAETMYNEGDFRRNVLSGRTFAEFKFLKDFTLTLNAAMDVNGYNAKDFDNTIVGDGAPAGRASRTSTQTTTMNFNQLLNYSKNFNRHSVDVLLGHENYQYVYDYLYGFRQNIVLLGNYELVNFTTTNSLTSYQHNYRIEGYFSRLNYGFDEKYFLSGSYRLDGSSRFHKDVRWGNFWSVGGAWRIDREAFMQQIPQINMLMFRASYGEVGNDNIGGYYPWQALYRLGRNNASEPGFDQSSLPAYDLTWESNNSFNLGLEFGAFQRLRGNIEFYHRITEDMLFSVPLPPSTGILSRQLNIGAMYNQGLELRLAADILKDTPFKWTLDVNASTVKNEMTRMPFGAEDEIISGTKKLMEGHSIYDYWLREWYGVDPEDGLGLYYAETIFDDNNNLRPDIRIKGGDTLSTLSTNARYGYVGTAIPDLMGGITNIFSFKNFELSVLMTYQVGGLIYDNNYNSVMTYSSWGGAMHRDLLNAWKQPGDVTDIPRLDPTKTTDNNASSSRWLIDGSFLNLRSVNLTYTLPKTLTDRLKISNARIYAAAENLFLFSKRQGMNIQQNFSGTTSNTYTQARIMTFGINLSF
jgi:TonB-linked SusC/RagA family outer membrane protein